MCHLVGGAAEARPDPHSAPTVQIDADHPDDAFNKGLDDRDYQEDGAKDRPESAEVRHPWEDDTADVLGHLSHLEVCHQESQLSPVAAGGGRVGGLGHDRLPRSGRPPELPVLGQLCLGKHSSSERTGEVALLRPVEVGGELGRSRAWPHLGGGAVPSAQDVPPNWHHRRAWDDGWVVLDYPRERVSEFDRPVQPHGDLLGAVRVTGSGGVPLGASDNVSGRPGDLQGVSSPVPVQQRVGLVTSGQGVELAAPGRHLHLAEVVQHRLQAVVHAEVGVDVEEPHLRHQLGVLQPFSDVHPEAVAFSRWVILFDQAQDEARDLGGVAGATTQVPFGPELEAGVLAGPLLLDDHHGAHGVFWVCPGDVEVGIAQEDLAGGLAAVFDLLCRVPDDPPHDRVREGALGHHLRHPTKGDDASVLVQVAVDVAHSDLDHGLFVRPAHRLRPRLEVPAAPDPAELVRLSPGEDGCSGGDSHLKPDPVAPLAGLVVPLFGRPLAVEGFQDGGSSPLGHEGALDRVIDHVAGSDKLGQNQPTLQGLDAASGLSVENLDLLGHGRQVGPGSSGALPGGDEVDDLVGGLLLPAVVHGKGIRQAGRSQGREGHHQGEHGAEVQAGEDDRHCHPLLSSPRSQEGGQHHHGQPQPQVHSSSLALVSRARRLLLFLTSFWLLERLT